jgi:DNA-binding SARP family transcriptional activator
MATDAQSANSANSTVSSSHELRIWLLGGLRVQLGGREVTQLGRWKRPAALLKVLALAPGHAVHREQIQDLLWPELDADAAANNLNGTLHVLRRLLEPGLRRGCESRYLVLQANLLSLRSSAALWIDVEAFELAAASAQRHEDPSACETAQALYSGHLLPEDMFADWAAARRDALHARFVELLHRLAGLYERSGDCSLAVRTLQRLVAAEPADEDAAASLMRLYALLGQRHLALRQYHQLQRALQRDLDCEPDARTARLRDEIWHVGPTRARSAARRLVHLVPDRLSRARADLTEREREITNLLARGLTNRTIAATLGISPRTAETHVSRILHKLDIYSRDQVALALTSG